MRLRAHHVLAEIDHLPAARVFAGLAIPGLILIGAGRTDLLIYAVFGSFTGMYGFAESARERLGHQLAAAVLLIGGTATGVALGCLHAPAWSLVAAVAVFAAATSPLTDRLGLRPQGPFFGLFACGAVAMVAGPDPGLALAVCAGTAALCVIVGYADAIRRPAPGGAPAPRARAGTDSLVQAGRYAVAVSVAGGIGVFLGVGHANWAMAGAAVPLAAAGTRDRIRRGVHRVAGTLAGLAVTAPLLLPGLPPAVLALAIIALLYPTELFMARHYALALGFFTPLIMSMTLLAAPADPVVLLRERGIDTVFGVVIGVAAAVVPVRSRRIVADDALTHPMPVGCGVVE
ncbi:FUSC family protein [Nocardia nova]|uniref:FUSC family protein n=1 Tax=Nocardia nova TaxID=37330 RepID=UPI0033F2EDF4